MRTRLAGIAVACLIAQFSSTSSAAGQDSPENAPASRSTGLPGIIDWTFNFDAGWGTFGFANSLFDNPREPGIREDLSDQWFEGYVEPALSGAYTLKSTSQWYGTVSVVGERTYGSMPLLFGRDVSSFGPEDLFIGWRSGMAFGSTENALDFRVGRSQYQLGHGLLLYDGAAEGGSRGGYWSNARKAFEFAAIARLRAAGNLVEGFYLDKDDLPDRETGSRLSGVNYEFSRGDENTFGFTYTQWRADPAVEPGRDGLHMFNTRAYTAPISAVPDLSFEFEYAWERNGEALHSDAWTLQTAYQLSHIRWTPTISYRYAFFRGDNVDTPRNEAFDPLLLGFYDWGSWFQGEIAGEYFLSNSNLKSKMFRAQVDPNDSLGLGVLLYKFTLDEPRAAGVNVTASDIAVEADVYADWKLNGNVTLNLVGAFANPGDAVQQKTGRTENFSYGMAYITYSF